MNNGIKWKSRMEELKKEKKNIFERRRQPANMKLIFLNIN